MLNYIIFKPLIQGHFYKQINDTAMGSYFSLIITETVMHYIDIKQIFIKRFYKNFPFSYKEFSVENYMYLFKDILMYVL